MISKDDRPPSFEVFRATLVLRWVEDAFAATETTTVLRQRLPADHPVSMVHGLAINRDRPISVAVEQLDLVLTAAGGLTSPLAGGS